MEGAAVRREKGQQADKLHSIGQRAALEIFFIVQSHQPSCVFGPENVFEREISREKKKMAERVQTKS